MLRFIFVFSILTCSSQFLWAEGLTATMGEVLLRNLQPGATYQLTPMLNFPLKVTYRGDRAIKLEIKPSIPEPNEMKKGFESIPDPNWISTDPSIFEVDGSSIVRSNITISIPNDDSLRGRKFVVYVWSQTFGKGHGLNLGLGAKSRLLITIATEKAKNNNQPMRSYMRFGIVPPQVLVKNVQPGKWVHVNKVLKEKFILKNTGTEDKKFVLKIVPGSTLGMSPPNGVQWGLMDTSFEISPEKLEVKAGKSRKFKVKIKIPNQHDAYGKKFRYILRATPEGSGMTSGMLFRMDIETKQ